MEVLAELSQFLKLGTRPDVLRTAVSMIVNLSANIQTTGDAVALFGNSCDSEVVTRLLSLLQSELIDSASLKIDILRILINATSFAVSIADEFSAKLFAAPVLPRLCSFVAAPFVKPVPEAVSETKNRSESMNLCNDACLLLSNLTREKRNAEAFFDALSAYYGEDFSKAVLGEEHSLTVSAFLVALAKAFAESEQGKSAGFLLRNLTQLKAVRETLLCVPWDKEGEAIEKRKRTLLLEAVLKPLWTVSSSGQATGWVSDARRIVAADILRNCCMDFGLHDAISKVAHLPMYFLWCLAGPEELTDDENECLPLELQYLEQTKSREPNVKLRIALLEALYQFCGTSIGRRFLRDHGAYYILREYHRSEQHEAEAEILCGNVIGVLIRTEHEIGVEDLSCIEVTNSIDE